MFSYLEKNILVIKGEKVGKIVHEVGPKSHTRKIDKISKGVELYHAFLCKTVSIFRIYKSLKKNINTVWSWGIHTIWSGGIDTFWTQKVVQENLRKLTKLKNLLVSTNSIIVQNTTPQTLILFFNIFKILNIFFTHAIQKL